MQIAPTSKSIKKIGRFISDHEPVTFFFGAGVSVEKPSFAPAWIDLRDGLLRALIKRSQEISVKPLDVDSLFNGIRDYAAEQDLWIKPEVVLEWLHSRLSNRLFDSLRVLDVGYPNVNHLVLAALCAEHPNICLATTNFDLYIEKAFQHWSMGEKDLNIFGASQAINGIFSFSDYKIPSDNNKSLLKLHGTLSCPTTIQATLRQVSSPVQYDLENCFKDIITDRHMIVMGYSGNDFDIFALFQKYVSRARSLLWFAFKESSCRPEVYAFSKTEVYIGDIIELTQKLWAEIPKPSNFQNPLPISYKTNPPDIDGELERWVLTLGLFEVIYSIAIFAMHIGSFEVSNYMCELLSSHKDTPKEYILRALNVQGINNKRNNPELAWSLYRKAIEIAGDSSAEHPLIYGNILGNLGALAHELGRNQLAMQYLRESNKYARASGGIALRYSNHDDIGNVLRVLGQPKKALKHHCLSEIYRRRQGDLVGLSLTLNNIGLAYAELKQYEDAEHYLEESIELKRRETCDAPALARGLMNLGEVEILLGKLRQAIKLLREARRISLNLNDRIGVVRSSYDIAYCLLIANHFRMAEKVYEWAEQAALSINHWTHDKSRMTWIDEIKEKYAEKQVGKKAKR